MILASLFDVKAGEYSPAVCYPNEAAASRAFVALIAEGQSIPALYPADFSLFLVGTFDESSGAVQAVPPRMFYSGMQALSAFRELQARRGGAVGGNPPGCPPEDSPASAGRNSASAAPVPAGSGIRPPEPVPPSHRL